MKRILTTLFVLIFSLAGFTVPVFAQNQTQIACFQNYWKDGITKYSSNIYYTQDSGSFRTWYWMKQQSIVYSTGGTATWQCENNKVLATPTGNLPSCLTQYVNNVTDDPNAFYFTDSAKGKVYLYTNNRYLINTTNEKGNWSCEGNKVVLGPITDNVVTSTTPTNTNPPDNVGRTDTNPPDNIGRTNTAKNTDAATNLNLQIRLKNPLCSDPTKKCTNTIQDAIKLFMDVVIKIAIPFIVIFFIWSGLNFILAQGNPEKLKKAKSMFWYTVIGTLLILGAWAITDAIVGTINSIAS